MYALDKASAALALISVGSIVKQSRDSRRLYFHFILATDLSWWENTKSLNAIVRDIGGNARFEAKTWSSVPAVIAAMSVRGKHPERYPVISFALIYVGILFPALDRYIYLDNIIFSTSSIDELWETSLDGRAVGMVQRCDEDFRAMVVKGKALNVRHSAVKAIFKTFKHLCYPSEGVLLVDQARLNSTNYVSRIEEWIDLNQREFVFQYGVHQLMVMATWGNCLPLEDGWNAMADSRTADTALVRFNAPSDRRFMLSTMVKIIDTNRTFAKGKTFSSLTRTACRQSQDELSEQWCKIAATVFQLPELQQLFNASVTAISLRSDVSFMPLIMEFLLMAILH